MSRIRGTAAARGRLSRQIPKSSLGIPKERPARVEYEPHAHRVGRPDGEGLVEAVFRRDLHGRGIGFETRVQVYCGRRHWRERLRLRLGAERDTVLHELALYDLDIRQGTPSVIHIGFHGTLEMLLVPPNLVVVDDDFSHLQVL